jgi:hypothetical protein
VSGDEIGIATDGGIYTNHTTQLGPKTRVGIKRRGTSPARAWAGRAAPGEHDARLGLPVRDAGAEKTARVSWREIGRRYPVARAASAEGHIAVGLGKKKSWPGFDQVMLALPCSYPVATL